MRARFAGLPSAAVLVVVAVSCAVTSDPATGCDDDVQLCPRSSKVATVVGCDCECVYGALLEKRSFRGNVPTCLPPELNPRSGTREQRLALASMPAQTYDQRVYQVCSHDVASFLTAVIRNEARGLAGCALPLSCSCTTSGASKDSVLCAAPCADVPCDHRTCAAVLRQDDELDLGACSCTRVEACGKVIPAADRPATCRGLRE